jgi:signal transduction histidine kinase
MQRRQRARESCWYAIANILLIVLRGLITFGLASRPVRRRQCEASLVTAGDVERKNGAVALASLSGRLIKAHEEERCRIAREIHDDYNQRLAMLAISIEELAETMGDSGDGLKQALHKLYDDVSVVGSDLQSLSHRLYSSTLENLGLVPGVKAFCKEFAAQQKVEVNFAEKDIPRGISRDTALCFFRIVQEALQNVKKHSGADQATVRLEQVKDRLHLMVLDRGKGFDLSKHATERGTGLGSMEERLELLGGQLEVCSQVAMGTRIDAWLPIQIAPSERKLDQLSPMSST